MVLENKSRIYEHRDTSLVGRGNEAGKAAPWWARAMSERPTERQRGLLGLDLQLGISKAESGSRFEKNSPPEVLTVVTGSIRHRSRRSWSCSTEI